MYSCANYIYYVRTVACGNKVCVSWAVMHSVCMYVGVQSVFIVLIMVNYLLSSELFWLVLSFCTLVALVYAPLKKSVTSELGKEISIMENDILSALQARVEAKVTLDALNAEYSATVVKTERILDETRADAKRILQAAQQKVLAIADSYDKLMKEDRAKIDSELIRKFKKDVLFAAVSAVEQEMSGVLLTEERNNILNDGARVFRKVWH